MYCKNCGCELNEKAVICPRCGCSQTKNKQNGCLVGCITAFLVPFIFSLLVVLIVVFANLK